MPEIEIQKVSKEFKEVKALDHVDLAIDRSEIFGLIGPDGAGKTTLFRILVSLLIPTAGNAKMCGHDVVHDYKKIRRIVGYMPGRFSLYHDLSVEENLNFYATVFHTDLQKNYDLIKDIYQHIEPFKKRRAGALSGGMKQKLALSCALVHRPKVLILDEPTAGVDAVSRKEFWDMLHKIRKEGITIVVSTPYMDEADRCDRVGLIQKGYLLAVDTPEKVALRITKPLYSLFNEESNFKLLHRVRKQSWCLDAWLFGQDIHLFLRNETDKSSFQSFMESNEKDTTVKAIKPGIEDSFIELIMRKRKDEKN